MFGKSLPVTTARTPGRAAARLASMLTIFACGCGLRSSLPCSIPGMLRSSAYSARPEALSRASFFGTGRPRTWKSRRSFCISVAPLARHRTRGALHRTGCVLHGAGGVLYGFDDLDVARASAHMADQSFADFVLVGLGGVAQQVPGDHDHSGSAEAA